MWGAVGCIFTSSCRFTRNVKFIIEINWASPTRLSNDDVNCNAMKQWIIISGMGKIIVLHVRHAQCTLVGFFDVPAKRQREISIFKVLTTTCDYTTETLSSFSFYYIRRFCQSICRVTCQQYRVRARTGMIAKYSKCLFRMISIAQNVHLQAGAVFAASDTEWHFVLNEEKREWIN